MYITHNSKFDTMNDLDLKTLKLFADITLKYLTEYNEYEVTQLWQHLENSRQYRHRLNTLYPVIDTIINHS